MKKVREKRNWGAVFVVSVLISFIVPAGYLLLRIVFGGSMPHSPGGRGREDYVLMLLQCLLGVAAILVPVRIMRRWDVQIPRVMFLMYIAFLYCAIFLGEVDSFFKRVVGVSVNSAECFVIMWHFLFSFRCIETFKCFFNVGDCFFKGIY